MLKVPRLYRPEGVVPNYPHTVRARRREEGSIIAVQLLCACSKPFGEVCVSRAREEGEPAPPDVQAV